jgi:hypothetical protein
MSNGFELLTADDVEGQKEIILSIVGFFLLVSTASIGAGVFPVDLGKWAWVDASVLANDLFVFERWLVIALCATSIFAFISFIYSIGDIQELQTSLSEDLSGFSFLATILIPLATVFVLGYSFYSIWQYLHLPGKYLSMKYATLGLLLYFVVIDLIILGLFFLLKEDERNRVAGTYNEALKMMVRLDLPILLAFCGLLYFLHSEPWVVGMSGSITGDDNLSSGSISHDLARAFGAGASAFKLVISVLVFTFTNLESCVSRIKARN